MLVTLYFYVGLSLFRTLNRNKARTTLFIVGACVTSFLDLVSKTVFRRESRYWYLVNLINLELRHFIKLRGPAEELKLWLCFEHKFRLLVRNSENTLLCNNGNLVSSLVAVLSTRYSDLCGSSFCVDDRG